MVVGKWNRDRKEAKRDGLLRKLPAVCQSCWATEGDGAEHEVYLSWGVRKLECLSSKTLFVTGRGLFLRLLTLALLVWPDNELIMAPWSERPLHPPRPGRESQVFAVSSLQVETRIQRACRWPMTASACNAVSLTLLLVTQISKVEII